MNLEFSLKSIYIAKEPIDFRKGVHSLVQLASASFDADPCDESLYIFTNSAKNKLKCLYYDGTGFWMFYKALNSGHFDWRMEGEDLVSITETQLHWLLDGLNIDTGTVF